MPDDHLPTRAELELWRAIRPPGPGWLLLVDAAPRLLALVERMLPLVNYLACDCRLHDRPCGDNAACRARALLKEMEGSPDGHTQAG